MIYVERIILGIRPKGWRIGQTLFNFFSWLKLEKGYESDLTGSIEQDYSNSRMADPFHISDADLNRLYGEYIYEIEKKIKNEPSA